MLAFEMTVKVAKEFYERCMARNAITEKEKTDILIELAQEGKMKRVIQTNRTPDQIAKDMSKNFGNVLYLKPKRKKKDANKND